MTKGPIRLDVAVSYALPRAATGALHVVGDGVVVPVVRWLAEQILEPLLDRRTAVAAE